MVKPEFHVVLVLKLHEENEIKEYTNYSMMFITITSNFAINFILFKGFLYLRFFQRNYFKKSYKFQFDVLIMKNEFQFWICIIT